MYMTYNIFSYTLITYVAVTYKYYHPNNILSAKKLVYYTILLHSHMDIFIAEK